MFSDGASRFSFTEHEQLVKRLTQLSEARARNSRAAEFLIRRCFYHATGGVEDGFYITFYLFGYGDDEPQARRRWGIGLKLVENAIRQISAGVDSASRANQGL